jgi:hypothetical protein
MAAFAKSWRRESGPPGAITKRCPRKIQLLAIWITDVPPFDGGGERPAMPTEGVPQPAGPGNPS